MAPRRTLLALSVFATLIAFAQAHERTPALIGYYAGNGKDLEKYHVEKLTHLIWCFAHLSGDSMVVPASQAAIIDTMIGFKHRDPDLKVLLSFGGWGGCATCSEVFARENGRRTFAASALRSLRRFHADGIDLDWEYPAVQGPPGDAWSPDDRPHFTALVKELRRALGDAYEISFAAGGTDACITNGFEWKEVMPLVDRAHIMSYDLVHGYSTRTGHHTPLFSSAGQSLSADHAVHLLDSLGVPREKVVIGSAFYARVFKDVPPTDNGLFQHGVFSHTVPGQAMDTTINAGKGWTLFRDNVAKAPWAYNASSREFITYDDGTSVTAKARYVKEQKLGGIMFWQLVDDGARGALLDAIYEALRGK